MCVCVFDSLQLVNLVNLSIYLKPERPQERDNESEIECFLLLLLFLLPLTLALARSLSLRHLTLDLLLHDEEGPAYHCQCIQQEEATSTLRSTRSNSARVYGRLLRVHRGLRYALACSLGSAAPPLIQRSLALASPRLASPRLAIHHSTGCPWTLPLNRRGQASSQDPPGLRNWYAAAFARSVSFVSWVVYSARVLPLEAPRTPTSAPRLVARAVVVLTAPAVLTQASASPTLPRTTRTSLPESSSRGCASWIRRC